MPDHEDDLRLVHRALSRDRDAVRALADRLACVPAFLRARASRQGLRIPSSTLDDLAQNAYLAIWRRLATYRGDSRLETWACGFCWNQLRGWRERSVREGGSLGTVEERSTAYSIDDTAEVVDRALDTLGPPGADVIRLKHFEELSFTEIAVRLELSPNTAKSHYYRGLARLRESLGSLREEIA